MSLTELKPCPFCGCHGVKYVAHEYLRHTIRCEDCPGLLECYSSTKEQAIAAWNRRAIEQEVKEESNNANAALLRSALVGLVGADTETELKQMEVAMRMLPAPEADKAVTINAIHALLVTLPKTLAAKGEQKDDTTKPHSS